MADTEVDAALLARDLLDYLPQHGKAPVQRWPAAEPGDPRPDTAVPDDPRKVYDVRHVAGALLDGGRMLEVSPKWAQNVVCACWLVLRLVVQAATDFG